MPGKNITPEDKKYPWSGWEFADSDEEEINNVDRLWNGPLPSQPAVPESQATIAKTKPSSNDSAMASKPASNQDVTKEKDKKTNEKEAKEAVERDAASSKPPTAEKKDDKKAKA
ncbi:uncharacterized protein KY384_002324 [Bacidia gigantensis]|uniref:uncharacterized protein n=1 Tax=Bacidia gigantensis TaxID=2732470 RepID=UPI001D05B46E|nr:uncharacterized protein KY384_002324 [Bacidia gigantensis]KAG8532447.1 hypothetical protein KY384_002324 [Bacidia gigantensis]